MRYQLIIIIILCLTLLEPATGQTNRHDAWGAEFTSCNDPSLDNAVPGVPMLNSSFNIILATICIGGTTDDEKEIELTYRPRFYDSGMGYDTLFDLQSQKFDWSMSTGTAKFTVNGKENIRFDVVLSPTREVDWSDTFASYIDGEFTARVTSVNGEPTYFLSGGFKTYHEWETLACDGPICYSSRVVDVIRDTRHDSDREKIEILVNMNENDTDFVNIGVSKHCCDQYDQINTTERGDSIVFERGDLMIGKENSLQRRIPIEGFDDTNFSSWKSLENGTFIQIENLIIEARIESLNDQIESTKVNIEIEAYYAPDPNETKKDDSSLPGFSNSLAILAILCGVMFYRRNGPESRNSK